MWPDKISRGNARIIFVGCHVPSAHTYITPRELLCELTKASMF